MLLLANERPQCISVQRSCLPKIESKEDLDVSRTSLEKKVTKKSHLRCSCSFLLLPLLDLSSQGEGSKRHAEALYIQFGVKLLKEPELKSSLGTTGKKDAQKKIYSLGF